MSIVLPPGALRLVFACIVVVSHYSYLSGSPLYVPIDGPALIGFFFFSGYWVARLWETKYSHCRWSVATFYLSRAMRIYPLAILGSVAMAAFVPMDAPSLLRNVALFGLQLETALNPPEWSLAVEVQFYAIAPLLFLLLRNRTAFTVLCVLTFCGWVVFALGWTGRHFVAFGLPFVLGAYYSQNQHDAWVKHLAPASLAAFVVFGVIPDLIWPAATLDSVSRFVVIGLSLVSLPYIAASLTRKSDGFDRTFGDLAYPVYLFHWPLFLLAAKIVPSHAVWLAVPLIAVVSVLVLIFIDQPLEAWRRAFVARQASAPVDSSQRASLANVATSDAAAIQNPAAPAFRTQVNA